MVGVGVVVVVHMGTPHDCGQARAFRQEAGTRRMNGLHTSLKGRQSNTARLHRIL